MCVFPVPIYLKYIYMYFLLANIHVLKYYETAELLAKRGSFRSRNAASGCRVVLEALEGQRAKSILEANHETTNFSGALAVTLP